MTAADMTQVEILTAVAYLQAVWDRDTDAVNALSHREDSERDILDVVIDLADRFGQISMLFRLGIAPDLDGEYKAAAEVKVDNDPTTAVTAVLIDAYRRRAKTAEGPAVRELSLSVIGYLAMSTKATDCVGGKHAQQHGSRRSSRFLRIKQIQYQRVHPPGAPAQGWT